MTHVKHFDTIEEVVAATAKIYGNGDTAWAGCSVSDARKYAINGYPALLEAAEKIYDQVSDSSMPLSAMVHIPDVWGQRLNMGEWLAGSPTCFRRKKRTTLDIQPLKIYVSTTSSAAIEAEQMLARGAAILAFLMKIQTIRPVDLYLVSETEADRGNGTLLCTVRIESRPLNLSQSCFAIGHVGFARQLLYGYARNNYGFTGRWPRSYDCNYMDMGGHNNGSKYLQAVASFLDFDLETDLFIPSAHISQSLIKTPVAWVNAQLARYAGGAMEE